MRGQSSRGSRLAAIERLCSTTDADLVVEASVANGWYLAFWPGESRRILLWSPAVVAQAETVRAYDASGQLLEEKAQPPKPPVGRFRELPDHDYASGQLDEMNIHR
jgi:hypothetical protein